MKEPRLSIYLLSISLAVFAQTEVLASSDTPTGVNSNNLSVSCVRAAPSFWNHDIEKVPNNLKNPKQVAVSNDYACAITDDGIRCWGAPWANDLVKVPAGIEDPFQISAGNTTACALAKNGIFCWGSHEYGEEIYQVPTGLIKPRQISVGFGHACVLSDDGVSCWGRNAFGQIKVPADLNHPVKVIADKGDYRTYAVTADGVRFWGNPDMLTDGSTRSPIPSDLGKDILGFGVFAWNQCATIQAGTRCWGPAPGPVSPPSTIVGISNVTVGNGLACGLTAKGLECWDVSTDAPPMPADFANAIQFDMGDNTICALTKKSK